MSTMQTAPGAILAVDHELVSAGSHQTVDGAWANNYGEHEGSKDPKWQRWSDGRPY